MQKAHPFSYAMLLFSAFWIYSFIHYYGLFELHVLSSFGVDTHNTLTHCSFTGSPPFWSIFGTRIFSFPSSEWLLSKPTWFLSDCSSCSSPSTCSSTWLTFCLSAMLSCAFRVVCFCSPSWLLVPFRAGCSCSCCSCLMRAGSPCPSSLALTL